ncbi:MAG: hypothetical protein AAF928_00675 [Myxococcota bacterium]
MDLRRSCCAGSGGLSSYARPSVPPGRRRRPRKLAEVASVAVFAWGCSASNPLTDVGGASPVSAQRTDQSYLLTFPVADGEELLGRAVQQTEDGRWTIADRRRRGCRVDAKRTEAQYRVKRRVKAERMTSLAAGFAKVVEVETRYGAAYDVDVDIDNVALLEVESLSGDCGETVVSKVFIGSGRRSLLRSKEARGVASGTLPLGVTPGVEASSVGALNDTLEWSQPQAYGYDVSELVAAAPLDLEVTLPSTIDEGASVRVTMTTDRAAWFVVFFLDADGRASVLWPSAEEPRPHNDAGGLISLPSPAERAAGIDLRAHLTRPGEATRETLIVYAFENEADFVRVRPDAGATDDDGGAFAASLPAGLSDTPTSAWTRRVVHYVIRPQP